MRRRRASPGSRNRRSRRASRRALGAPALRSDRTPRARSRRTASAGHFPQAARSARSSSGTRIWFAIRVPGAWLARGVCGIMPLPKKGPLFGPTMQIEAVKAAYRRYAAVYDAVFGPVLQPGRKAVMQALGLRPGDRVLEVGVGTGLSLPLYPREVKITGIDLSREMLEKARRRVERRRLANIEALVEMDAERMSFPDASFDK